MKAKAKAYYYRGRLLIEGAQPVRCSKEKLRSEVEPGDCVVFGLGKEFLDCLELAKIALPRVRIREIKDIASALGVEEEKTPVETLKCVWLELVARVEKLHPGARSALAWLAAPFRTPLGALLRGLHSGEAQETMAELFPKEPKLTRYRPEEEEGREPVPLGNPEIESVFSPGGDLSRALGDYEERPQQLRMALEVARAFNEGLALMVEAGTGVGKSMAYLVPAAQWVAKNGGHVVVSTNTKNLQAQLFYKDLPLVEGALGRELSRAVVKGRRNYLCLRRFFYILREAPRELRGDDRWAVLQAVVWASRTRSGEFDELARPEEVHTAQLSSSGDECRGRSCAYFDQCFVRKARGRALQAEIVICNHALFFAELRIDSAALPPHDCVVFDEAHNLEDVATEHLATRVNRPRIYRVLNRLFRAGPRGGPGTGLYAALRHYANGSIESKAPELAGLIRGEVERAAKAVREMLPPMDEFFHAVAALLMRARGERLRVRPEGLPRGWEHVVRGKESLSKATEKLISASKKLDERLKDLGKDVFSYAPEFRRELGAQIEQLEALLTDLAVVVALENEEYVYWLEGTNLERAWCEACSAPVDVSDLLQTQVFQEKRTAVLTSATLTVMDSFDFLATRLGVKDLEGRFATMQAGTPFDFENQVLTLAAAFLPPPNAEGFTESLARLLVGVFKAAGGRSLALFTSHAMLRDILARVEPGLKAAGLTTLAQGRDGTRAALLETLARGEGVVLLGTASFWEGVDVKGEALSCLVLARLPFQVYTDPIFEARRELVTARGGNDFYDYSVPCAVLKLRQGFGRLIRSKSDRGVVLITDSRILKKSYGRVFIQSLPAGLQVPPDERSTAEAVKAFLERGVSMEFTQMQEEEWSDC